MNESKKQIMESTTYLGDGLYAAFDGYQFWLWADRGGRRHSVALETEVLLAFLAMAGPKLGLQISVKAASE